MTAITNKQKMLVLHGDCREILPTLPVYGDGSAVITSPPYNMRLRVNSGGNGYCSRGPLNGPAADEFATKYGTSYEDAMPMDDYEQMTVEVVRECLVVAPVVVWNVQLVSGNKPALLRALGTLSDSVRDVMVWRKPSQPAMKDRTFNSGFEFIVVFERGDCRQRRMKSAQWNRGTVENVIETGRGPGGARMPDELASSLIQWFTTEDGTVIDPFAGWGTTGRVARELGRSCTLIDSDRSAVTRMREEFGPIKGTP